MSPGRPGPRSTLTLRRSRSRRAGRIRSPRAAHSWMQMPESREFASSRSPGQLLHDRQSEMAKTKGIELAVRTSCLEAVFAEGDIWRERI